MKPEQIDITGLPLDQEFDRLQSRYLSYLRFPAALENVFHLSTAVSRAQSLAIQGWLMNATYCLLIVSDYFSIRPHFHTALLVRCGIVLPVMMLAKIIVRSKLPPFVRSLAVFTAFQAGAYANFFLYRHEPMDAVAGTQVVTVVILLGICTVLRFRLPLAAAATLLCVAGNSAFLFANPLLTLTNRVAWSIGVVGAAVFTLMAGYTLEREERLNFLFQLRNQAQSSALAAANTELQRLSECDALTGIANRAAFDQRFVALWNDARVHKTPLSVVLIDIDHFKRVNDTHGHLYGDEVLKRVAALLIQCLRGKHDFAARFGGEEFVILLPDSDRQAAYNVAERVRAMIEIAGSPAPINISYPEAGIWTTVSCGIATLHDISFCTRQELLHAADTALYAAKAAGRNRVQRAAVVNCKNAPGTHLSVLPSHIN